MRRSRATQHVHEGGETKYITKRANIPIGVEGSYLHLLRDILGPRMSEIVSKPMLSSITTIRNYPRGPCLHPALLSCTRAHIPLLTLKSVDKSIKRRKWGVRGKAGRESSEATRRDSWTMVSEDIKGYTTIKQVRGDKISH